MTEDIHRIIKFDYMQELNLPKKITFPEGYIVNGYYYDGVKYSKTRFDNNSNLLEEEKFFGNLIIRNNRPFRILHDEGYVDLTDMGQVDQKYYHIKDHLGNVRVVIQDYNHDYMISQVSTYYPFGMVMQPERFVNSQDETDNPYLYNGKEQQEMPGGWYDYGARFYDPQLGRWQVIDNKAEKYYNYSPFVYAINNPLRFIDPDGNEIVDAKGNKISYSSAAGWSKNATNDIKVIYSALMETKTGKKQWNKAYNSDSKIEMVIVEEKLFSDKTGKPVLGKTNQAIAFDAEKVQTVKTDKAMKIRISQGNIEESFEGKNKNLTLRQAIGATAGHEIEHTTEENRDLRVKNSNSPILNDENDVETKPNEVGNKIRNESRQQSITKMEPSNIEL